MKKIALSLLTVVLAAALIFGLCSCNQPEATEGSAEGSAINRVGLWADADYVEDTTFGSGAKTVVVEVKVGEESVTFTIKTDKTILGEALIEHNLIAGEEGPYGLYIKQVNGITADYDIDQSYWGFYKNGEYMMSGVDTTEISDGEHYELVYSK